MFWRNAVCKVLWHNWWTWRYHKMSVQICRRCYRVQRTPTAPNVRQVRR